MKYFTKSMLMKSLLFISLACILNMTNAIEINKGTRMLADLSDQEIMQVLDVLMAEEAQKASHTHHGPIVQQESPTAGGAGTSIPEEPEPEIPLSPAEAKWLTNLEIVRAYIKNKRAAEYAVLNGDAYKTNGTNMLNYTFQDYTLFNDIRLYGHALLYGANSTNYASNSTNCFNNMLNLVQFDFDLLLIRYMYGDVKNHILNTTLFMRNISDVSYVCIDALENLYVFSMFKFELFGLDWVNVLLGFIQNLLGSVLTINKIYQKVILYPDDQILRVYYDIGRIIKMIFDFEPIILEDAANPLALAADFEAEGNRQQEKTWNTGGDDDDDEIIYKKKSWKESDYAGALTTAASVGIALRNQNEQKKQKIPKKFVHKFEELKLQYLREHHGNHPLVSQANSQADIENQMRNFGNDVQGDASTTTGGDTTPSSGADDNTAGQPGQPIPTGENGDETPSEETTEEGESTADEPEVPTEFDLTFGLSETIPGLKALITVEGPVEWTKGFLNGTSLEKNDNYRNCETIVADDLVSDVNKIINKTGTLFEIGDFYENVYNIFDILMYTTRLTQRLHPAMQNCIGAGEFTYLQFYDVIVEDNGYNPKAYIMNTVYNFGHIFDGLRDTYLFFVYDPRGDPKAVYHMGYNLGQSLYYFITPNIADYYSDAKPYVVKEFEIDAEYEDTGIAAEEMTQEQRNSAAARAQLVANRLQKLLEQANKDATADLEKNTEPISPNDEAKPN